MRRRFRKGSKMVRGENKQSTRDDRKARAVIFGLVGIACLMASVHGAPWDIGALGVLLLCVASATYPM